MECDRVEIYLFLYTRSCGLISDSAVQLAGVLLIVHDFGPHFPRASCGTIVERAIAFGIMLMD